MTQPTATRPILSLMACAALTILTLGSQAAAVAGSAPPTYKIKLAGPNPSASISESAGINPSGVIGGTAGGNANARTYVFGPKGIKAYGVPPGQSLAFTNAINKGKAIAGQAGKDFAALHPYVGATRGAAVSWTQLLGLGKKTVTGSATSINSRGDVAGFYYDSKGHAHGVWWPKSKGYSASPVSLPAGTKSSYVLSLDNGGDLAGKIRQGKLWEASVWEPSGQRVSLSPLQAGEDSAATAVVRASGTPLRILVAGYSANRHNHTSSPTVWTINGSAKPAASSPSASQVRRPRRVSSSSGFTDCQLAGINRNDTAVGHCGSGTSGIATVLWQGTQFNLNTLIPSKSGWKLWSATGINAKGQITGTGSYKCKQAAFILTPK